MKFDVTLEKIFRNTACFLPFVWLIILWIKAINLFVYEDETSFFVNTIQFTVNQTMVPLYANYPSFYSYFLYFPTLIVFIILILSKGFTLDVLWNDPDIIIFLFEENMLPLINVGRFISAIFSLAILICVMRFCNQRYGSLAAVLAGTLLMLDPSGVFLSYACWALPEMLITLFVMLSGYCCLRFMETHNSRFLSVGGFMAGLAMAAKLNAAMALFALFFTSFFAKGIRRPLIFAQWMMMAFLGFFCGTPLLILMPGIYKAGFALERHLLIGGPHDSVNFLSAFWLTGFLWSTTPVLMLMACAGVIYSFLKRENEDKVFLFLLIPSVVILGSLQKQSINYFIFLYPLMAIQMARFFSELLTLRMRSGVKSMLWAGIMLCFLSWLPVLRGQLAQSFQPDNRLLAKEWIQRNIPSGAGVLIDWYVPKLLDQRGLTTLVSSSGTDSRNLQLVLAYYDKNSSYRLINLFGQVDYNLDHETAREADYLVTSNLFSRRFYGPGQGDRLLYGAIMKEEKIERIKQFYGKLHNGELEFNLVKRFNEGKGPVISVFQRQPD